MSDPRVPVRDRVEAVRSVPLDYMLTEDDLAELIEFADAIHLTMVDLISFAVRRELIRQASLQREYRTQAGMFDEAAWKVCCRVGLDD